MNCLATNAAKSHDDRGQDRYNEANEKGKREAKTAASNRQEGIA
jgi:hypothetical protein